MSGTVDQCSPGEVGSKRSLTVLAEKFEVAEKFKVAEKYATRRIVELSGCILGTLGSPIGGKGSSGID